MYASATSRWSGKKVFVVVFTPGNRQKGHSNNYGNRTDN
jgi:hypothetical protein